MYSFYVILFIIISLLFSKSQLGLPPGHSPQKNGFCLKNVELMMFCASKVKYNISVNGELVGPITPKRGIRQGGQSPYLFILCTEGLSTLIRQSINNK